MEDRELLKNLNNLKSIKPDNNWKKEYRDILLSQISAGQTVIEPKSNLKVIWESIMPREILINFAKPVWMTSLASFALLAVVIGGVYASKNSKPGDSLYIAKIISEKAQFAMTFDEKNKAKLGVEFATNRAKEMIQVLEDTDQPATANNDKLEKLSQNFKKEISQVKNRLSIIKAAEDQAKETESEVFGANLGKSNQRMELAEPVKLTPMVEPVKTDITNQLIGKPATTTATSTIESANQADSAGSRQADQMLEEAEKLSEEKSITGANGAIDKLKEVKKVINQTESGQVQGVSETATSTD